MRALIVDDEEDIGLMVSKFLKDAGLDVHYETNITAARDRILTDSFGLYFLDLNLSDGTGFDLIPDIKSRNESAKVVIISAFDGINETRRSKELEVDLFIKKPFSKRQILQAVNEVAP